MGLINGWDKSNMHKQVFDYTEELNENPIAIIYENKKYCPECWKVGKKIELKGSRPFLCEKHYKEYRQNREKIRIKIKRSGYDIKRNDGICYQIKVIKDNEYNTKIGTSDFGSHLTRNSNENPDFEKEAKFVKKELKRIMKKKTIGDYAYQFAGKCGDAHLPESRERLLNQDNLFFNEGVNGYIQVDLNGNLIDKWTTDQKDEDIIETEDINEFFKTYETKTKSRKEIYKDWNY